MQTSVLESSASSRAISFIGFQSLQQSLINRKTSNKRRNILSFLKGSSMILFFLYIILPFFKKAYKNIETDVTAVIFSIPDTPYNIIQIIIMVLMIINRVMHNHYSRKIKVTRRNIILTLILITVIITNIFASDWLIDLLLRPFFLVCYSTATLELAIKFGKIIYGNFLYYVLMWMFIVIFSSIGHMLFKNYNMQTQNFFNHYWDAFFELIVLQATSNYPDVALPYYQQNKATIFVFISFIFISTVTINGFIIASSYRTYMQLSNDDKTNVSLKMLLSFIKIKIKKLKQQKYMRNAQKWRLFCYQILSNPFFKFINWTLNLIIFMISWYYPQDYTDSVLAIILVFMILTSSDCILILMTKPWRTIPRRPFLLFDLLNTCSGLIIVILVLSDTVQDRVFRIYMFLRTPVLVKPIFLLMFKNRVISDAATSNSINGNISQLTIFNKFIPQFMRIIFLLFINLLFFSAIGQMAFAGAFTESQRQTLIDRNMNKLYIYLNFNNTLTSFNTLFTLLIVNNWNLIVNSYVAICGNSLVRIFFIAHYMASVLVAYNVLVVSIIEFVNILSQHKQKSVKINQNIPPIQNNQLPLLQQIIEYYIENSINPSIDVQQQEQKRKPELMQTQLIEIINQMKKLRQM